MEKAEPIFTEPYYIAKIWAAPSAKRWGKDGIGEAVLFSAAPDCPVMTPKGATCGRELLRRNIAFPRQVKAIATALPLSVQVHPVGKNEVWYIDSATAGARVYVGFRRRYSFDELQEACAAGTVLGLMGSLAVKSGDVIAVPGGTPHAIGGNISLYEVGDIGNVTYRLFDYGRGRALQPELFYRNLAAGDGAPELSPRLKVARFDVGGSLRAEGNTVVVALKGGGVISSAGEKKTVGKDSCFFLAAGETVAFKGSGAFLLISEGAEILN